MSDAPRITPPSSDATRARLLESAGEVFAAQGYQAATVRDICARAGANVAAVNYHFGDKMGLYTAALRHSIGIAEAEDSPEGTLRAMEPEDALRLFISGMLHRMYRAEARGDRHFRMMAHEMAQPTEALPRVIEEIIGPKYAAIRGVISRIIGLPPGHDKTRLCAHSVIGQVVHYAHARPVIACVWPALEMTPARLNQIAAHIADFSLCSLRALQLAGTRKNKEPSSR